MISLFPFPKVGYVGSLEVIPDGFEQPTNILNSAWPLSFPNVLPLVAAELLDGRWRGELERLLPFLLPGPALWWLIFCGGLNIFWGYPRPTNSGRWRFFSGAHKNEEIINFTGIVGGGYPQNILLACHVHVIFVFVLFWLEKLYDDLYCYGFCISFHFMFSKESEVLESSLKKHSVKQAGRAEDIPSISSTSSLGEELIRKNTWLAIRLNIYLCDNLLLVIFNHGNKLWWLVFPIFFWGGNKPTGINTFPTTTRPTITWRLLRLSPVAWKEGSQLAPPHCSLLQGRAVR